MYNRLHTIPTCDGRTDGRTGTSCHGIVRAMHTRHAVKMTHFYSFIVYSHCSQKSLKQVWRVYGLHKISSPRISSCRNHKFHRVRKHTGHPWWLPAGLEHQTTLGKKGDRRSNEQTDKQMDIALIKPLMRWEFKNKKLSCCRETPRHSVPYWKCS